MKWKFQIVALLLALTAGTAYARPQAKERPDFSIKAKTTVGEAAQAIDVYEEYAYIGFGPVFQVVDITDVQNPADLGSLTLPGEIRAIQVVYPYAYVLYPDGLWIIDIANPLQPTQSGTFVETDSQHIEVRAGYAYLLAQTYLIILDVSDPFSIMETGRYQTAPPITYWFLDLEIQDHLAFVLGGSMPARTWVFDISSPEDPTLITVWPDIRGPAIAVRSNILYNASGGCSTVCSANLATVDISNLNDPALLSFDQVLSDYVEVVKVFDIYAYMGSHTGAYVFNIANPADVQFVTDYFFQILIVRDLDVQDSYLFLATEYGLQIVETPPVYKISLPMIASNP